MGKKYPDNVAILNSSIHFQRYELNKTGKSIKEIAEAEGIREETVKRSIEAVLIYRSRHTHENMNQALTGMVMALANETQNALSDALTAEIEIKDGDKKVHEPDHTTRMRAVSEIRQIAQVVQPKTGPSTNVNVGVGVNQSTRVATGGYIGMEDRLRQIRKERAEQPQLEGRTVVAGKLDQPQGEFEAEDEGEEDE